MMNDFNYLFHLNGKKSKTNKQTKQQCKQISVSSKHFDKYLASYQHAAASCDVSLIVGHAA